MKRPHPVATFLESPSSIRNTIRVLVLMTCVTTLLGGLMMWIFDRGDFDSFGDAMWWSLQTVTTVGYGDITPKSTIGRYIGAAYLVYSVAFLSILTAAVTATFIEHVRRQRRPGEPDPQAVIDRLDAIAARLDRLEQERGRHDA